jgi:hypothetical protein
MSISNTFPAASLGLLALIAGCTSIPTGPSVMALPGSGKSFEQFRYDDGECRGFAQEQTGPATAQQAGMNSGVATAAVGTAIGAAAGAALGGHGGAGAGAATGLLFGSAAGLGTAQTSSYNVQTRYNNAYTQCMYAKGNRVPVAGQIGSASTLPRYAPPPAYLMPPPPNGYTPMPPG